MLNAHELQHFLNDELFVCGCGIPNEAAVLVHKILKFCPLYDHREEFEKLLPNDGAQYLILCMLTEVGLIEHGGGIGGSWATDKGTMILQSLNKIAEVDMELESIFADFDDPEMLEMGKNCPQCQVREIPAMSKRDGG